MINYTPLHVHTDSSPDGLGNVTDLLDRANELQFSHIAITDHGTVSNWITFFLESDRRGIVPIFGVEAYLEYNGKTHHLTLLGLNRDGFDNIINVQNKAAKRSSKKTIVLRLSDFENNSEGIIALTGCPSSAIHEGELQNGIEYAADLIRVFGKENVYAEIMFPNADDHATRPLQVAEALGIKPVVTNDVHFCHKGQGTVHQFCVKARKGFTYDSSNLWLKSAEEIIDTAKEKGHEESQVKVWIENTNEIASRVESFDIRRKPKLPKVENVEEKIKKICYGKLENLKAEKSEDDLKKLKTQFQKEFGIFQKAELLDYFYIVWDIHQDCRKKKIKIGVRGSAVGCVMAYLLGLTDINPLDYGLIFERFYNPKRLDYPDIDSDIASDKRQQVLEYANKKWGAFPVATESRYSHKSLIRDIGRILGVDPKRIDKIAELGEDTKEFAELKKEKPIVKNIYDSMNGQIRHRGKHAGGISITDVNVPLERLSDGTLAAGWTEGSGKTLFQVGVVKFDFLGLSAWSQIASMEELTGKNSPTKFDDPKVFDLFKRGDTAGVFQYGGSAGIKEFVELIQPNNLEDLIAINALYRPGTLDSGTAYKYPQWMKNPRKLHPDIDPILDETYGVICYQEQFMKIFAAISNSDFGDADKARKVISNAHKMKESDKDFWKSFGELEKTFFDNGKKNGFSDDLLHKLWEEIKTHGRYSFNKSHSTAYAILAYQMAWFKCYYPGEFYTAILRHTDKNIQTMIFEAISKGFEIKSPNINVSTRQFEIKDNEIYFPLSIVKYFGDKALEIVLQERRENGPFNSYKNFSERIPKKACNKRVKKNLWIADAFVDFADDPEGVIDIDEIPFMSDAQRQIEAYGFRIPNKKLVRYYEKYSEGYTCGIVEEIETRNNGYGTYYVVRLAPFGSFWIDKKPSFSEGDFVVIKKSSKGKFESGKKIKA